MFRPVSLKGQLECGVILLQPPGETHATFLPAQPQSRTLQVKPITLKLARTDVTNPREFQPSPARSLSIALVLGVRASNE